ncbi:MAG TPA: endolytic transglycosylase MltG [Bacteroidales bacterium]|nr:endolytic transglycosylase MltG [Bacteroidales bacterium]
MRKRLILAVAGFLLVAALAAIFLMSISNLRIKTGSESNIIYIPTGSDYESVFNNLVTQLKIKKPEMLEWIAKRKKFDTHFRAGKYSVPDGTTYMDLIDMLRSGRQKPVNITFNNIRTLSQLAGKVGGRIEADSASIIRFLSDESNFSSDGFTKETVIGVFIPNTYEFLWNTDAKGFYNRMLKEYKAFWNDDRIERANKLGLTPNEVSILASIVDDEVAKADEKPRIAGVYLNRIRIGMPLQACPTIKFALNDFTITRVLTKYLVVDSPYNTYKHKGFPPGPVGCPSIEGIESVLNAEKHNYLYFAAKADFSGYHNFSRTLSEHNRYANQYQRELDRRKIFK